MRNLIITALIMFSLTSFAQEKRGMKADRKNMTSEQKVEFQVKKLSNELSLNEKQIVEIRSLVKQEVAKRETKRNDRLALQEKRKEEKKAMVETRKAEMQNENAKVSVEMKKILTPEQFTKWEKMKEENKAKLMEKRGEKMKNKKMKSQNKN